MTTPQDRLESLRADRRHVCDTAPHYLYRLGKAFGVEGGSVS